jgi:hypothetical protein
LAGYAGTASTDRGDLSTADLRARIEALSDAE